MKKWTTLTLTALTLATATATARAEMTGREIMQKQKDMQSVETEYGADIMLIKDTKSNSTETRNTRRYSKEPADGLSKSMFVFLSPANIAGTAVLTWEQEVDDDQWLYIPATKKMQRIASGSKKNYFMGTDFTYEDMEPEDMDNFTYTVLKTESLDVDGKAVACWVVEAVPANEEKKRASGYSKRTIWVDQERFVTLKAEFYDRRERLIKTQTVFEVENVTGTVCRPKKTMMDNPSKNSQTLSMTTERKVNEPIDDEIFTERFILSGRHTQ